MDAGQTMTRYQIMMSLSLIAIAALMLQVILFVIFGLVTVRKLRKNPATRNHLGVQFVPGWVILNVSIALARPRRWAQRVENSPLGWLVANSQLVRAHTTRLDRMLARVHFWSYAFAMIWLLGWLAYGKLGGFPAHP